MRTNSFVICIVLQAALGIGCVGAPPSSENSQASSVGRTLRVTSDAELARLATRGAGSASDPYVLAGHHIAGNFSLATGSDLDVCFDISNTTRPFRLEDCSCRFAHVGVRLSNVRNATLEQLSLTGIIGVFGWATEGGGGENGVGVQLDRSSDITLSHVTVSDVYGGFGTFGTPGSRDARGRAGGAAVGIAATESRNVDVADSQLRDLWGGAGGAGAVGLFAGDSGGNGGLGGMAIAVQIEGGGAITVERTAIGRVRAGAGAAAAVSNVFLWGGGNGGNAGDGNDALGIVAHGTSAITITGNDFAEQYGRRAQRAQRGCPGSPAAMAAPAATAARRSRLCSSNARRRTSAATR